MLSVEICAFCEDLISVFRRVEEMKKVLGWSGSPEVYGRCGCDVSHREVRHRIPCFCTLIRVSSARDSTKKYQIRKNKKAPIQKHGNDSSIFVNRRKAIR